jgi:hypothetical protein
MSASSTGVARLAAVGVVVAALAGAVGAAGAAGGAGGEPDVRLTVVFARDAGGPRHIAHLRCTGDRATADGFLHPVGPVRACRTARRAGEFLARRPPRGRACTQLFGGFERAHLTGRIGTRVIDRRLSRTDGCEIADYDRAVPLVPRPRSGP